ncbi:MAG: nitrite/sulfite reductase [Acidimicrobiia bacterium]
MAVAIDIPGAKRAGLPIDLDQLTRVGDAELTPEQRYALKTHGVCAQLQDHVFMVRVRVPGGVLAAEQARALAAVAGRHGRDWLHLTTRQNVELHWVADRAVADVLAELGVAGLSTRSACGHTLRNVMCADEAGVGLDEPFDCLPDAQAVSDAIVARSATLNCELPSRVNLAFGGSPRCRQDARINDGAFVSVVRDGVAGYEVWAGGSLGKAPRLGIRVHEFIPRTQVIAAAEALIDLFVQHGDFEHPAKGRLKFVVERLGADEFRAEWRARFADACARPHPATVPVEVPSEVDRAAVLGVAPPSGWGAGVRPQRTPGLALVTVDVPMGDLDGATMVALADFAERYGDGTLRVTRDQDVVLRDVPTDAVDDLRNELRLHGMRVVGEKHSARVRACTGSVVCALGIANAPGAGEVLLDHSHALRRHPMLRVHVSGCPNSCAQHQVGDIGLAGAKVRVHGETFEGYQVYVGADVDTDQIGEVVGRVAERDVVAAVDAIVGAWEALRHDGEPLGRTARRVGLDAIAAHVGASLERRWESGVEPEPDARDLVVLTTGG